MVIQDIGTWSNKKSADEADFVDNIGFEPMTPSV